MKLRVVIEGAQGAGKTLVGNIVEDAAKLAGLKVYRIFGEEAPSEHQILQCDLMIHELQL